MAGGYFITPPLLGEIVRVEKNPGENATYHFYDIVRFVALGMQNDKNSLPFASEAVASRAIFLDCYYLLARFVIGAGIELFSGVRVDLRILDQREEFSVEANHNQIEGIMAEYGLIGLGHDVNFDY